MKRLWRLCHAGAFLAGLLLLATAPPAEAARGMDLLRLELSRSAAEIKAWLAGRAVQVEPFRCPDPDTRLYNGRILNRLFEDALKHHGVTVRPGAEVSIRGTFHDATDAESQLVEVKIHLHCSDNRGSSKHIELSIHEVAVLTVLFPRVLPVEVKKPNMFINREGEIFARKDGKFAIMLWVARDPKKAKLTRDDYRPAKVWLENGQAQATLDTGQIYAVQLFNNADHDVSVVLSLDGLDQFAFHQGRDDPTAPSLGYNIVRKGKGSMVMGWHLNRNQVALFRIGENALKGPGEFGIITAQFFSCWDKPEDRPGDEGRGADRAGDRLPDKPGGKADPDRLGPVVQKKSKMVRVNVGQLRESIPVLYRR